MTARDREMSSRAEAAPDPKPDPKPHPELEPTTDLEPGPGHSLRYSFEDPFATPAAERRQDRRLRGRLVAPVTVWTAGAGETRAGLTVASVLVVEGEPPRLIGAIDPLSDLREAIETAGGPFVVHLLEAGDRALSERFAGSHPGDPFEGLDVAETEHGPRLAGDRPVALCRLDTVDAVGHLALVRAVIERIELAADDRQPLAYYLGHYRTLSPRSR